MNELYLDANAHVPMHPKALDKFIEVSKSHAGHGHAMSPSAPGRAASNVIEESRGKIAELLGAETSNQIIFTSTCTEACEWGVSLLMNLDDDLIFNQDKIYVSPTEHPAIKQAVDLYFSDHKELPIDKNGIINTEREYEAVICIHVQNEIGIIQPIEKLKTKYLISDMSQTPGKVEFNLSSVPVNIATFGAHKFGGPGNVGFLYMRDVSYWSEHGTGSRYFMDRPGTPDAPSIAATAVALEESIKTLPERQQRMKEFRDILEPGLKEMGFEIISETANRCPNTTFVYMPNGAGMLNMLTLGEEGIHVGLGSACGSAYTGPSPLMQKLGHSGGSNDYMRISQFGEYGANEAKLFLNKLEKICQK